MNPVANYTDPRKRTTDRYTRTEILLPWFQGFRGLRFAAYCPRCLLGQNATPNDPKAHVHTSYVTRYHQPTDIHETNIFYSIFLSSSLSLLNPTKLIFFCLPHAFLFLIFFFSFSNYFPIQIFHTINKFYTVVFTDNKSNLKIMTILMCDYHTRAEITDRYLLD